MRRKHLIIGAGSAGLSALGVIRSISKEDEIKIVSAETCPPYSPTSLPALISGRTKEADVWLKDGEYFRDSNVNWETGKQVVQLIPKRRQVVYSDGDVDDWDTLLIASGSEPVRPHIIKGMDKVDALFFNRMSDYHGLNARLSDSREITVLGAGLVGMELANALCEAGHRVTVIERESAVLPLYLDEPAAGYIKNIFLDHGVNVFTGKDLVEVKEEGDRITLICQDGQIFSSDLLVICAGVKPKISFIEGTGINSRNGIIVDRKMETNVDNIYAAGDVAEAPSFFGGQLGINAIILNAVAQGKVAGANMAGVEEEFQGWLSMNVVYFFDNFTLSIGLHGSTGNDAEVMETRDDSRRQLKRLLFHNNALVGAMLVNEKVHPGALRYLIENKVELTNYKELLFQKTDELSLWLMLEAEREKSILSR